MNTDPLWGLTPYEKTQSSGEIKSNKIPINNPGEEPTDEIQEILPNSDKVELSSKIDFNDTLMTYHLTHDRNLNEYILMANQAVQLKESHILSSKDVVSLSVKSNIYPHTGCDIKA